MLMAKPTKKGQVFPTDLQTQQAGPKCIDIDMSFRCQNDIFSYALMVEGLVMTLQEVDRLKQPVKRSPATESSKSHVGHLEIT